MLRKLLPIVIINVLLLYVSTVSVYSNNRAHKTRLPKQLIQQLMDIYYDDYKGNVNKLIKHTRVRKEDLNNDNNAEYLVLVSNVNFCGSAGCQLEIYHKGSNEYECMLDVGEYNVDSIVYLYDVDVNSIKVLKTSTNGYFDLACFKENRTVGKAAWKLKFNGKRYVIVEGS